MNKSKKDMAWGLIREIPDESQAAWGARAIQREEFFELLIDRQDSFAVSDELWAGFWAAWGRAGMLGVIRDAYKKLWFENKFRPNETKTFKLYEDRAIVAVGNTNSSHGYLYLAGYLKPHLNSEKLPPPGSAVYVKVNNIGKATVIRHDEAHGYPMAIVIPHDPPKWYREQNKIASSFDSKIWGVAGVFPNEIELTSEIENRASTVWGSK